MTLPPTDTADIKVVCEPVGSPECGGPPRVEPEEPDYTMSLYVIIALLGGILGALLVTRR